MKREFLFILLALVLASLACSTVVVSNTGSAPVIVELSLPDGSFYSQRFEVGESEQFTAAKGGTAVAHVLPDQEYINKLKDLRDNLALAMTTEDLNGTALLKGFAAIQSELRVLEGSSGIECTAEVPEEIPEGESSILFVDVTYREGGGWECGISQE